MIRALLFAVAALAVQLSASPAVAQDISVAPNWENPADALPHPREVAIGIPREAGSQRLTELADFNNSGGLDNIAQYRSADGEVFGTLYIYRTTLADPGIAAIATDFVIRNAYGEQTRLTSDSRLAIDGDPGLARMMVYEHAFDGERTSVAVFLRAGQWTVKIRVSGPQARHDEIVRDAQALLDGLQFGANAAPSLSRSYPVSECSSEAGGAPARLIEGLEDPATAVAGAAMPVGLRLVSPEVEALIAPGLETYCVMGSRQLGQSSYVIAIRPTGAEDGPRFVMIGDAGRAFEILSPTNAEQSGYVVAMHGLGGAPLFGPFDRHPTAEQFFDLVSGSENWLGGPAAVISASDGGDLNIELPGERSE